MMYYLAVFRSQTQTYSFAQILNSYNIGASVISTPRQAQVSCGLSVQFSGINSLNIAREILERRQFSSFVSFFSVRDDGDGFRQISRI